MCSYDVIEHIYDIEGFLRKLPTVPSDSLRIVFASGANGKNPLIRRKLRKKQVLSEHCDRDKTYGHKERDTLVGFLRARKKMVATYCPELSADEVEVIAVRTRGLRRTDIEKCVDEYRQRGTITYKPSPDTNTCDPFTGNWAEHVMDTGWLKAVLEDAGFDVKILSGYWGDAPLYHKRLIKALLDSATKYCGNQPLMFAPYYVVFADFVGQRGAVANGR